MLTLLQPNVCGEGGSLSVVSDNERKGMNGEGKGESMLPEAEHSGVPTLHCLHPFLKMYGIQFLD